MPHREVKCKKLPFGINNLIEHRLIGLTVEQLLTGAILYGWL
jgi:hypothetical protein